MSVLSSEDTMLVCPVCHSLLIVDTPELLECSSCHLHVGKSASGSWDFRDGHHFIEWFADDSANQSLNAEEIGSLGVIDRYLIPILQRCRITKTSKILSDGCGIGVDVERLRYHGYDAWGIDPGDGRGSKWQKRSCSDYLVHGSGTSLPFADCVFDFVFSEGVIEHVGLDGDQGVAKQLQDKDRLHATRQKYITEIIRVLTPGGTALIAGPNRWFPIDFFHGGQIYGPLTMAWHRPGMGINSAWRDIQYYLRQNSDVSLRVLSLRKFFNTQSLAARGGIWALAAVAVDAGFAITPKWLMSSVGPYFAVALTKQS